MNFVHKRSGHELACAMLKQGCGGESSFGVASSFSWWDLTLMEGAMGCVSNIGVSWSVFVSGGGIVVMHRCINWRASVFWFPGVGSRVSRACVNLMASDLLIVAILVRMCWRCVVSLGLSLMYMYRFLAVFESCTYILG